MRIVLALAIAAQVFIWAGAIFYAGLCAANPHDMVCTHDLRNLR